MNKKTLLLILVFGVFSNYAFSNNGEIEGKIKHGLKFNKLATSWDEAIPLGNATIGALVWEKEGRLRFSLDRGDLWDLRPMDIKNKNEWKYKWIIEQHKNNTYGEVQRKLDELYSNNPAPTKIPGAAMEFNTGLFGKVKKASLTVANALCEVEWENNVKMTAFVHAAENIGWFRFVGVDQDFYPLIVPPKYDEGDATRAGTNSLNTQDLITLGYKQGKVVGGKNSQSYIQEGWDGFKYHVYVEWKFRKGILQGVWSISTEFPEWQEQMDAKQTVKNNFKKGYKKQLAAHKGWWKNFWSRSTLSVPDKTLEKQWYLEMYKFGSTARKTAPPISLQSIWTADNGKIPPWKGDYHHDLNTQLSYWPAYSGNHLELEAGFVDWLWDLKGTFEKFTKEFYDVGGLNVPGTTSLDGIAMGGWSQYSYSPTTSAWLAHHFYLHWRYSMDRDFLEQKAYPWIKETGYFLENIMICDKNGMLKLPLSSSPEIYNNYAKAWFTELTNYDLSLIRWTFEKAVELAKELKLTDDEQKWKQLLARCPDYAIDPRSGLMFAPGFPFNESHRHHSHLMPIHPLGNIDYSQGKKSQEIINTSIKALLEKGSRQWTGYSFSWLANIQARMFDGEGAAESLRIFTENFCLPNSFHVNGEQHNRGYSDFKYRPFTLEGNFAFAAGLQEMLIQSHTGVLEIFPAIPESWKDLSFNNLRAEGAFLVSAVKKDGEVQRIEIVSEKGGTLKLKNPFGKKPFRSKLNRKGAIRQDGEFIIIEFPAMKRVTLQKDV
ncbi:MAG TPA: hypothetical protein DC024_03240 [Clostridiales bacterium]|jgi:alpha-L-fucosidase 2|nr:hypothetical protein [Clostridiales bacterium]